MQHRRQLETTEIFQALSVMRLGHWNLHELRLAHLMLASVCTNNGPPRFCPRGCENLERQVGTY